MDYNNAEEVIDKEVWERIYREDYSSKTFNNVNIKGVQLLIYPGCFYIYYCGRLILYYTDVFTEETINTAAQHAKFIDDNIERLYPIHTCLLCNKKFYLVRDPVVANSVYDHFMTEHLPMTKSANKT